MELPYIYFPIGNFCQKHPAFPLYPLVFTYPRLSLLVVFLSFNYYTRSCLIVIHSFFFRPLFSSNYPYTHLSHFRSSNFLQWKEVYPLRLSSRWSNHHRKQQPRNGARRRRKRRGSQLRRRLAVDEPKKPKQKQKKRVTLLWRRCCGRLES